MRSMVKFMIKKVGGVKGIKSRGITGTTQNPEIIVTITLKICSSISKTIMDHLNLKAK